MGKLLCRFFTVIILVAATANFAVVLKTSPAFNSAERQLSVMGDWRVPNIAAHYDKSEYLLELGYGYLNEIGLTYDPETDQMALVDEAEMEARTLKAMGLIEQSIRLDPANASAWAYLAQAQGRNNDIEGMRDSLDRSWALAPNNLHLAPLRLTLVMQLYQNSVVASQEVDALSDGEIASARRDGEVLEAQSPGYPASLMSQDEPLMALLGGFDRDNRANN